MSKIPSSTLRIIGGQWKRRNIRFLAVDGLRPTPDRVRETLFNWLQFDIANTRCLDCFAGSGALGLEALSRGATSCLFIEKHPAQARQLQQTLGELMTPLPAETTVACQDALSVLHQQKAPFDVIFIDPPYALNLWQPICQALVAQSLIHTDTVLYLEADREWSALGLNAEWHLVKETQAGTVRGFLVHYHPSTQGD